MIIFSELTAATAAGVATDRLESAPHLMKCSIVLQEMTVCIKSTKGRRLWCYLCISLSVRLSKTLRIHFSETVHCCLTPNKQEQFITWSKSNDDMLYFAPNLSPLQSVFSGIAVLQYYSPGRSTKRQ